MLPRVLKRFPVPKPLPNASTPAQVTEWIRLTTVLRETVQPSLTSASGDKWRRKARPNKLSYHWQNKRSKAIQIVLNNSEFPNPPTCPSNCDQVQSYYELRCQGETLICDPLPTHRGMTHDPTGWQTAVQTLHILRAVRWRMRCALYPQ